MNLVSNNFGQWHTLTMLLRTDRVSSDSLHPSSRQSYLGRLAVAGGPQPPAGEWPASAGPRCHFAAVSGRLGRRAAGGLRGCPRMAPAVQGARHQHQPERRSADLILPLQARQ
jgi:hypothetical protein